MIKQELDKLKKEKDELLLKWKELEQQYQQAEKTFAEQGLKNLPVGAKVQHRFSGYFNPAKADFGENKLSRKTGKKIKDGKKYMIVDFGNLGKWKVPYPKLKAL